MSKYIDANLTVKLMLAWADRETNDECRRGYHDCIVIVNDMPAADVSRIAKGEWKKEIAHFSDGSHYDIYKCSNCNVKRFSKEYFCPNCGAEMKL